MLAILKRFKDAARGDSREAARALMMNLGVPLLSLVLFMVLWSAVAPRIQTSLGTVPGPVQVFAQAQTLWTDYFSDRKRRVAFYERQEERNKERMAEDPGYQPTIRAYTGKPTYLDQILTSLKTVFAGFLFGTVIAVPLGILAGSSRIVQAAINPIVQIFRPVSPLAWLPIVTLVVSALYVTAGDPMFEKSFLVSAITVTLCSVS